MLKKIIVGLCLLFVITPKTDACQGTFYVCNMEEFSELSEQLLDNCEDTDVVNIHFINCNTQNEE
ncbi:MAG: hypothetical protein Sapg2KO_32320 [Saprospiraceae bacterium]